MRVILADLKSCRGFVRKDTVVGGYGSRLDPFSRVTTVTAYLKKQFHDVPSVHLAYMAAILARAGHEVRWTRSQVMEGEGRSDAGARRQGGVCGDHRLQDAAPLRRSLRFHSEW